MARGSKAAAVETGLIEGPWELPEGWQWESLAKVGQWGSGGTPKAKTPSFYGGSIPWFKIGDLRDGWTKPPEQTITELGLAQSSAKIVPANTLLVAMYGSIGKLGLTSFPCATNQAIAFCIPHLDRVELKWLFYYLLGRRTHLLSLGKGGTQQNISQTVLLQQTIPVPPLDTQRRIVARIDELFSELDDGEAALSRARAYLETYRKSLLKAAVTGELTADWRAANPPTETGEQLLQRILADRKARWEADPKNKRKRYKEPRGIEVEGLPELPNGWCWATLEQLAWQSGYGTSAKCDYGAAGEPVLRIPNLRGGGVDVSDLKRARVALQLTEGDYLAPGDLLIVRTNGSKELIGRAGIVEQQFSEKTHFASYLIRFRIGGSAELHRWIRLFTDSALFRSKVLGSIGSSAGQYNLSLSKLDEFPVAVPPQTEVGAVLEAVQSAELTLEENLPSAHLRQSILAAAFRGELVQ